MGRETGKRGLRAFVNWVENGGEPEMELAAEEVEQSHAKGPEKVEQSCALGPEEVKQSCALGPEKENQVLALRTENQNQNHGRMQSHRTMRHRLTEFTEEHALMIFGSVYRVVARIVCLAGMAVLLMMVSHLPAFGGADNPAVNEVAGRYLEQGLAETGAVNTVAGIILDYRAFDTFGESAVLFLAAASVVTLTRRRTSEGKNRQKNEGSPMREHVRPGEGQQEGSGNREEKDIILEEVSRLLVPFILMFGIYVVLNGHLSPGGGFSGGTVMGAGLILYANAFGYARIHRFFSFRTFTVMSSGALAVYALSKGYSFYMGANHLESGIPLGTPGNLLSAGLILPLDICVGLVVAGTMYCFYSLFREGEV